MLLNFKMIELNSIRGSIFLPSDTSIALNSWLEMNQYFVLKVLGWDRNRIGCRLLTFEMTVAIHCSSSNVWGLSFVRLIFLRVYWTSHLKISSLVNSLHVRKVQKQETSFNDLRLSTINQFNFFLLANGSLLQQVLLKNSKVWANEYNITRPRCINKATGEANIILFIYYMILVHLTKTIWQHSARGYKEFMTLTLARPTNLNATV